MPTESPSEQVFTNEQMHDLLSLFRAGCPDGLATKQDSSDALKVLGDWTKRHVTSNEDADLDYWKGTLLFTAVSLMQNAREAADDGEDDAARALCILAVGITWLAQEFTGLNELLDESHAQKMTLLNQRDELRKQLAESSAKGTEEL